MRPVASIIITNHNYRPFLAAAIDSALAQTVDGVEVIVVDDGSTDGSSEVIARYKHRVRSIVKERGGQASACNAGFAASSGEVIVFLDADDLLRPHAVARALPMLDGTAAKVHWPLLVIDEAGCPTGQIHPRTPLPEGDFRQRLIDEGPWMCEAPPTSGNAWSRRFLENVLPIPEGSFVICADAYLLAAAPLFGRIARIDEPLSCYRLHSQNNYWNRPFELQLQQSTSAYEKQCRELSRLLDKYVIAHSEENWLSRSWWHRLDRAIGKIVLIVPQGAVFGLADQDEWGTPAEIRGRRRLAFPGVCSAYSGPPASDAEAVHQLSLFRESGAAFFVLGWPALWYLDHFPGFAAELEATCRREFADGDVVILSRR